MNNIFSLPPLWRISNWMSTRPNPIHFMRALIPAALLVSCAIGCGERDIVRVNLRARPLPQEPLTLVQIEAQVAGPTDGLQYKWFAVSGECEPQESEQPKTVFKFPEGVRQDRVSVEVWRGNRRVAQSEIKLKFDEEQARRELQRPPEAQIEITAIPPSELGGANTSNHIDGKVNGKISPDYLVAIYVRAYGAWYIQPDARALHPIKPGNTWGTWTHTGTRYAALLVRPDYEPLTKLDMLPQTNNYVLALDIVDGLPKQQLTNAGAGAIPSSQ